MPTSHGGDVKSGISLVRSLLEFVDFHSFVFMSYLPLFEVSLAVDVFVDLSRVLLDRLINSPWALARARRRPCSYILSIRHSEVDRGSLPAVPTRTSSSRICVRLLPTAPIYNSIDSVFFLSRAMIIILMS